MWNEPRVPRHVLFLLAVERAGQKDALRATILGVLVWMLLSWFVRSWVTTLFLDGALLGTAVLVISVIWGEYGHLSVVRQRSGWVEPLQPPAPPPAGAVGSSGSRTH